MFLVGACIITSCENEETVEPTLNAKEELASEDQNKKNSSSTRIQLQMQIDCSTTGATIVQRNTNGTYTYSHNISDIHSILWTVVSGDIQITGGQGTSTITVYFGTNFRGGQIKAYGANSNLTSECAETISISRGLPPPPCAPTIPSFQIMDPNWNGSGETCPNYLLELGVVSDERCSDFIRYEWIIQGATVQNTTPDGRYIFVTTGGVGTYLTFKVRGVYQSGTTSWSTQYGRTISGICGGGA